MNVVVVVVVVVAVVVVVVVVVVAAVVVVVAAVVAAVVVVVVAVVVVVVVVAVAVVVVVAVVAVVAAVVVAVVVAAVVVVIVVVKLTPLSLQAVDSTKLWGVTWTRIDQFLPGFLKDLFPNVTPPPPPPSPPSPPSSQSPLPVEQVDSSTSPDSLPTASSPLPVSQSPARSPDRSPQASPPSSSPGNSSLWSVPQPPSSPQVAQVDMLYTRFAHDVPYKRKTFKGENFVDWSKIFTEKTFANHHKTTKFAKVFRYTVPGWGRVGTGDSS